MESDSLSQETESPGEMFYLIIKNIPSKASDREIIEMYVENATKDDNMEFEIEFNDTGDQALLSFQQYESGPEEVMEKLRSTQLLNCTLEVDIPPPIKDRLLVRNIRPDADEMMVVLHFESAKFNPDHDIEVEVEFSASKKAAIVTLPDLADVSPFLSGDADHSFLGPEVVVERCNFFTCLESIGFASGARGGRQNRGRSDRPRRPKGNRGPRRNRDHDFPDNSSDQGTTERGRGGRGPRRGGRSGRFRGRGRGGGGAEGTNVADEDVQGGFEDIQKSFQRSVSVQPQFPDDQPNQRRTDWNKNRGNTMEGRYNQNTFNQDYEPDSTTDQRRPYSGRQNLQHGRSGSIPNLLTLPLSIPPDDDSCSVDLDRDNRRRGDFNRGNRDFNRGTKGDFNKGYRGDFSQGTRGDFNRGTRGDYHQGTRDFTRGTRGDFNQGTRGDFNRGYRGDFNRGHRGDFTHGTRGDFNRGTRGDFNQGNRGGRHMPGSDSASEGPMTETRSIDIRNEVQHEKCHLLIQLTGEISRMYGCRVHVDKANHAVNISGRDETSVTQTALLVHEKLSSMYSMKVSIGQRFAESLCCKKGYEWIKDFLMKNELKANYYLNQNKQPEILAENTERAIAIAMLLQKHVDTYRVSYNSSQKAHLQSEDWKKFVRSAEGNWLVTIDVTDSEVCLEGVHPDFSLALNSIQYELTDNSRVTESISMVVGKLRFLQAYHPDIVKTTKASLKYKIAEGVVEISGTPDALERAKSFVERTSHQLVQDDLVISEPGVNEFILKEKGSMAKAFLESLEKNYECVIEITTLKDPSVAMSSMQSVAKRSPVNFNICSKNRPNIESVKGELKKLVKTLVYTSSIKFRMDLTPPQKISILQLQSKSLEIKIDEELKVILLSGSQQSVEKIQSKILNLLEDFKTKETDLEYVKKTKGKNEYMKAFGTADVVAPEHWQHYKGSLRNISEYKGHLVEVGQSTFDAVSLMVFKTWHKSIVGLGQDAVNLHHRRIQVRKVFHVENVALYKRYATKLKEFCLQKSGEAIPSLQDLQLYGERDVETLGVLHLDALTMSEVNECFLFHGTEISKKDAIINQGFDGRLGSQRSLFGQGIYFAESATKADQYADPKTSRVGAGVPLYMFVVRVLLGRTYVCNEPRQFRRPPCTDLQCCSDTCSIHPLHDSIIGTHNFLPTPAAPSGVTAALNLLYHQSSQQPSHQATRRLLFREFVVYDHSQCYPEFLVEYERI